MSSSNPSGDDIDLMIQQWRTQRPDLDLSALGVLGRIARLNALLAPLVEAVFARHGLSGGDFDVLTVLRRAGPPFVLTPSELSSSLMMSRAGMTSRLDRLEHIGLIQRRLDSADRRSFQVGLTRKGRVLIDRVLEEHARNLASIVSPLTNQQMSVLETQLKNLLAAVSATSDTPRSSQGGARPHR